MPTSNQPIKWSKYLLLVEFGFLTMNELRSDIRRYQRSDKARFMAHFSSEVRRVSRNSVKHLFVVKLVPLGWGGQLPNYRVEGVADLKGLPIFLKSFEDFDYVEVWYCRTRIDRNVFSVAGRFLFTPRDDHRTQSVEQVWRCSPRLLEHYSSEFQYPYVRASRYAWGWPYAIEAVHASSGKDQNGVELVKEFRLAMQVVERMREQISLLLRFLDSFRFAAYSIEYKLVGSHLQIIDWDTPDDRRVITKSLTGGCETL